MNDEGIALGPECFPTVMWAGGEREPKAIPDLFQGMNGFVVLEKAADVLLQFDLGEGGVDPVKLLRRDRLTAFPDAYSF
ncbi:hypothetical protein ABID26_002580 [Mesorhizobium shonense]|uniref:Uncharacterized protein n=1 Tax=Mesorhizobium shonense TaxID=1209948 RepID=A0ABV2HRG3_9HYPH|nr:hypothetical protein [Mesorhizobium sp.]TIS50028.1 MAG: hypothetical protein E5W96_11745 [Mesorhizobium sp.]